MHHVAIMQKERGFLEQIITGTKVIESRWLKVKAKPWNSVAKGDTVYFRNTGGPIIACATVNKVKQIEIQSSSEITAILKVYGAGLGITPEAQNTFFLQVKDKKYLVLLFLSNTHKIRPFQVSKKGFGAMSAWITVADIETIKI